MDCTCKEKDPKGELVIRTIAMPKDTNDKGDIFGGWLMSQMDIGGGIAATEVTRTRVITVAVTQMRFWHPVKVGDVVCVHANLDKIGKTSIAFLLNAWALGKHGNGERKMVTEAIFTYVSIDEKGRPIAIKKENAETAYTYYKQYSSK